MQSAKEAASNVAASAKAGMDKTRAVAEEKAEKLTTRDPLKKEMAEMKKDARINEAESMKHETRAENVAARREHGPGHGAHGYTAIGTGATGYSTGTAGLPAGHTPAGTFGEEYPAGAEYPAGTHAGTGRTGVQDPRATGGRNTGYGPGATY